MRKGERESTMKFCEHCGAQLEESAKFCNNCGTAIDDNLARLNEKINKPPVIYTSNVTSVEEKPKLSEIVTPAKKEIKTGILVVLIVLANPIMLAVYGLGGIIGSIITVGIVILIWKKYSWKNWLKVTLTVIFVLFGIVLLFA